jgi:phosphoserine aminotransferase
MSDRVHNFAAGPAIMPESVLAQIRDEMLSLPGLGMSVMEISHRSAEFKAIHAAAQTNIRELLKVPDNYEVLFLQGGSRLQFAMIPMNLGIGQYIVTGTWGKKALEEAKNLGGAGAAWNGSEQGFVRFPSDDELDLDPAAQFVHVTSNETIQGVQFGQEPAVGDIPLVCDCSSDFMCRPLPIEKYGMIYACAQKNAGPAGVTVVIIRKDLLERSSTSLPSYMNYQIQAENDSMYNTPPTFGIYVIKLIGDWLRDSVGGLEKMRELNRQKSALLYDAIDKSAGFYKPHAAADSRSLMNVVFNLPSEELDSKFVAEAAKQQLVNLKGHRSVGGIRASVYNAMPLASVEVLRDFMIAFHQEHQA